MAKLRENSLSTQKRLTLYSHCSPKTQRLLAYYSRQTKVITRVLGGWYSDDRKTFVFTDNSEITHEIPMIPNRTQCTPVVRAFISPQNLSWRNCCRATGIAPVKSIINGQYLLVSNRAHMRHAATKTLLHPLLQALYFEVTSHSPILQPLYCQNPILFWRWTIVPASCFSPSVRPSRGLFAEKQQTWCVILCENETEEF